MADNKNPIPGNDEAAPDSSKPTNSGNPKYPDSNPVNPGNPPENTPVEQPVDSNGDGQTDQPPHPLPFQNLNWQAVHGKQKMAAQSGGAKLSAGADSGPWTGGPQPLGVDPEPLNPYNPGTPNNDFIHGSKSKMSYIPPYAPGDPVPTAIDFPILSSTISIKVTTEDITNSQSGGYQVMLDGVASASGQIVFNYDALNVPGTAANIFRPRTYATLLLKPDGITIYKFAALIESTDFGIGPLNGAIKVTANYQSTGKITYPSASLTEPTVPLN